MGCEQLKFYSEVINLMCDFIANNYNFISRSDVYSYFVMKYINNELHNSDKKVLK